MKIKVLKTTKAAENPLGNSTKEYLEGQIYEIFDELAEIFIQENWGEKLSEEKAIDNSPENKAIKSSPENKSRIKKIKE